MSLNKSGHLKSKSKQRQRIIVCFVAALVLCITSVSLADNGKGWRKAKEFDEFTVFIEIDGTDKDAGIKGLLGGEPWKRASIFGPNGRLIYRFGPKLSDVGSGTVFWESAEPPFAGFPLETFLERFPEGEYIAKGRTLQGNRLKGTAELTHNLPAGPVITSHENDEVVELTEQGLVVTWEEVTDDYRGGPLASQIVGYIVTITYETEILGESVERELTIDVVPPNVFSAEIPADFLEPETRVQIEVAAREESGNQTSKEVFIDVVDSY